MPPHREVARDILHVGCPFSLGHLCGVGHHQVAKRREEDPLGGRELQAEPGVGKKRGDLTQCLPELLDERLNMLHRLVADQHIYTEPKVPQLFFENGNEDGFLGGERGEVEVERREGRMQRVSLHQGILFRWQPRGGGDSGKVREGR